MYHQDRIGPWMRNRPRVLSKPSGCALKVGQGNRTVQKGQITAHTRLADDLVPAERLHRGSTLGPFGRFRILFGRLVHRATPGAGLPLSHSLPWLYTWGRSPPKTAGHGRIWPQSRPSGLPGAGES